VVRHNVDDEAKTFQLERLNHAVKAFAATNCGIDLVGVSDIVSVCRTGRGGEDRRRINVADAKAFQIGHQRRNAVEGHAVAELDAVGGCRNVHELSSSCMA
jgi:hypothetical protein